MLGFCTRNEGLSTRQKATSFALSGLYKDLDSLHHLDAFGRRASTITHIYFHRRGVDALLVGLIPRHDSQGQQV